MSETFVNHNVVRKPLSFEKSKETYSDIGSVHKNNATDKSLFDTYLQNKKLEKPTKNNQILKKSKEYTPSQKNDNHTLKNHADKKINPSENNETSQKHETEKTESQSHDDKTKKKNMSETDKPEKTAEFSGYLIDMIIAPSETINILETDISSLDPQLLRGEDDVISDILTSNTQIDTLLNNSILNADIQNLTDFVLDDNILSLDNNSVLQSNGITDMVTNTTIAQSINSDLQIQIQKSSELEAIATVQLPDNMSLKITKDVENDNKIGINLEPAGLGNVELVIETNKDNAVTAVIRSDKAEILDHLRKESASLERYLAEAGLNLGGQGLGFEQKQQQDDNNQNQNNSDTFTASISEAKLTDTQNNQLMTTTEKLYAHLDRQSAQQGLDIRL